MLSDKAKIAVACLMSYGCTLQIFPYAWDSVKFRLTKNSRLQNWWFNFHSLCMFLSYSFVTFRCISTVKEQMPARVRMMNVVWVVAFGLTSSSTIQFYRRRGQIMVFANALFQSMEMYQAPTSTQGEGFKFVDNVSIKRPSGQKKLNWSSWIVLLSAFMLYTNGPAHAMVLWYGPCTPTYLSSVIHNCTTYLDMPLSILEATPYVLWEYYIIGFVLAVWSFNWTLIFLGWLWIKDNLKKVRVNMNIVDFDYAEQQYRHCQVLAGLLNDAFAYYLQGFPSVLFTMAGMMLFGTIRYTYLPFYLYSVFPSCGYRCLYEAITALAAAGMLHQESIQYLDYLEKRIDSFEEEDDRKYKKAFHKSCRAILCTAGSMYTFENSIVLVSLYNCTQLTFNMLVTYD